MKRSIFIFSLLSASLCMAFSPARAISQDSINAIAASVNADIESGRCLEFLNDGGPNAGYHKAIRDLYIKDREYTFSYYVTPSLESEYSLGYNSAKGTLEYNHTSWEDYSNHTGSDRKIETAAVPIPADLARSLSELVSAAVAPSHLRHFVRSFSLNDSIGWEFVRVDGVTHEFHDKDGNAAQCMSPNAGNSKELVQIMETVCQLVEDGKSKEISSLKPDIDRLTKKFGK